MEWGRLGALAGVGAVALIALTAAQRPTALANAPAGQWEIKGVPGAKAPALQCLSDVLALAQFEHRGKSCTHRIITNAASSTVIEYSCGGDGFGRTKINVITPRNLRIETQGISDNMPFNYLLQARRVGDCPSTTAASH
jgi:hypothetical protein